MPGVIAGFPPDADGLSWLKSHPANLLVTPTIPHSKDRKHPRGRIPRVERPETLGQTNLTARPRPRSSCFRRARLDETNLRSLGRLRRFRMGGDRRLLQSHSGVVGVVLFLRDRRLTVLGHWTLRNSLSSVHRCPVVQRDQPIQVPGTRSRIVRGEGTQTDRGAWQPDTRGSIVPIATRVHIAGTTLAIRAVAVRAADTVGTAARPGVPGDVATRLIIALRGHGRLAIEVGLAAAAIGTLRHSRIDRRAGGLAIHRLCMVGGVGSRGEELLHRGKECRSIHRGPGALSLRGSREANQGGHEVKTKAWGIHENLQV